MASRIVCRACGNYHVTDQWPVDCSEHHALAALASDRQRGRNGLPMPFLATDTMPEVQSQATGKFYDSKSALRREYKTLGMVEVGNDPARNRAFVKPKPDRKEIKDALGKARARYDRGERSSDAMKFL